MLVEIVFLLIPWEREIASAVLFLITHKRKRVCSQPVSQAEEGRERTKQGQTHSSLWNLVILSFIWGLKLTSWLAGLVESSSGSHYLLNYRRARRRCTARRRSWCRGCAGRLSGTRGTQPAQATPRAADLPFCSGSRRPRWAGGSANRHGTLSTRHTRPKERHSRKAHSDQIHQQDKQHKIRMGTRGCSARVTRTDRTGAGSPIRWTPQTATRRCSIPAWEERGSIAPQAPSDNVRPHYAHHAQVQITHLQFYFHFLTNKNRMTKWESNLSNQILEDILCIY